MSDQIREQVWAGLDTPFVPFPAYPVRAGCLLPSFLQETHDYTDYYPPPMLPSWPIHDAETSARTLICQGGTFFRLGVLGQHLYSNIIKCHCWCVTDIGVLTRAGEDPLEFHVLWWYWKPQVGEPPRNDARVHIYADNMLLHMSENNLFYPVRHRFEQFLQYWHSAVGINAASVIDLE